MAVPSGMSSNPFEVLGLDRTASFDDVKLAYRRLAREYHPDTNPNDPAALERFTALRRAYDRLKIFYQTLEDAGPTAQPAPAVAASARPASVARGLTTTSGLSAHLAAVGSAPLREVVAEPAMPGTGGRRAFKRTGPMRQSGEISRHSGDLASPPMSPQAMQASRPGVVRLAAPQQIGSGHLAARAEVIYGYTTAPPSPTPQMLYALVGLRASDGVVFPRVPLNLCLVLDHSSSMLRGGKAERLKETVRELIGQLDDEDYLSIVSFGDRAEVLLPAQPLHNRAMVLGAIDAMRCRGGTEISRGLAAGLSELSRNASRALSHLILLTDGQTYGDEMVCLERAEEAAGMNVGVTAYGLGTDWNSTLLDGIAGPTGGHSDYIESPEEMVTAFKERVHALQSTTLRKVTLAVQPANGCTIQRATLISPMLRPLDLVKGHSALTGVLGDLSSNTDYRMLLEFMLGPCQPGPAPVADLTLTYDVPGLQRESETLPIPIATTVTHAHDAGAPVDPRVTDALRHMTVHRLQQQAWAEINHGDVAKGTGLLKRAAEHLEVAGHTELAEVAATEAARVESGNDASDENIKRIIYGTRKLG